MKSPGTWCRAGTRHTEGTDPDQPPESRVKIRSRVQRIPLGFPAMFRPSEDAGEIPQEQGFCSCELRICCAGKRIHPGGVSTAAGGVPGRGKDYKLGPGPSWMGFQRSVVLFFLYVELPWGFLLCWEGRELALPGPVPSMCLKRPSWLSTLDMSTPKAPRSPAALLVFPGGARKWRVRNPGNFRMPSLWWIMLLLGVTMRFIRAISILDRFPIMRQPYQLQSSLTPRERYIIIIHLGTGCLHVSASSCVNPIKLATHRKSSQSLPCQLGAVSAMGPGALMVIAPSFPRADLGSGRGSARIPQASC